MKCKLCPHQVLSDDRKNEKSFKFTNLLGFEILLFAMRYYEYLYPDVVS